MAWETLRRTVKILNPQGFHMRPMQEFVELATKFRAEIAVIRPQQNPDEKANGKSMLNLLVMAAQPGEDLTIEVQGEDAAQAFETLVKFLESLS